MTGRLEHSLVGNVKFDKEHAQIFNQLNYLATVTIERPDELLRESKLLMQMMVKHCIEEEQFMLDVQYKFFDIHREQHVELTQYLKRICGNILELSDEVVQFQIEKFGRAMQDHIEHFDIKFYLVAPHNGS